MSLFWEHHSVSAVRTFKSGDENVPKHPQHGQGLNDTVYTPELTPAADEGLHDLICIGFGPASLAIAVALKDALNTRMSEHVRKPRICFVERQHHFAWHAGMLLPGSKMQISFIKDLATLRNPRSEFTFLNYLKQHNRLVEFSNLGTFLPSRAEFEDYLRWCANHFTNLVEYDQEALEISPYQENGQLSPVNGFSVRCRSLQDGSMSTRTARNVVIAIGGTPHIPPVFPIDEPRIIHSSQYCSRVPALLPDKDRPYKIAVVGSGQSGAEIFHDLHQKYPKARTWLISRDTALRPSDDSPFVNEVFDPERVNGFYNSPSEARDDALRTDRNTNYGVVRSELLEQIYHDLYQQKVKQPDEHQWQHRVLRSRAVTNTATRRSSSSNNHGNDNDQSEKLFLTIKNLNPLLQTAPAATEQETLEVDAVLLATGYVRNAHEALLKNLECLRRPHADKGWRVRRDYKLEMDDGKVSADAGVWLQGCNERTHGLSDTLLSTLATRGGEMVQSIFGWSSVAQEG